MGFLTGNFQNLMVTRLLNQSQRKLTRIMSQMRSAKRQAEQVEKQINSNVRIAQNQIRSQGAQMMQQAQSAAQMQAYSSIFGTQAKAAGMDPMTFAQNLMQTDNNAFTKAMATGSSVFNMALSQGQMSTSGVTSWMQNQLACIEQEAEIMKEIQLEPLKDLESDLEVEKASVESDIQLYTQWKEGAKEDVQAGAKSLKPTYTAQG